MPNYIRIINRPYWPKEDEINIGVDIQNIEARTITQDLKTKDNTLSLWYVSNEDDAVLAIVSCAQKIEDIHTLKINDDIIENSGLEIENKLGKTIVEDLNEFHFNIKNLTYKKLADVSNIIIESLKNEKNFKSYTRDDIIRILRKAIEEGRIKEKSLAPRIREQIKI